MIACNQSSNSPLFIMYKNENKEKGNNGIIKQTLIFD